MLTRRHVRIKVIQSVYAISFAENTDLEKEKAFFKKSVSGTFELYNLLLSLFKALTHHATKQLKLQKKAQIKDAKKIQNHSRFSSNTILQFLGAHPRLEKQTKNAAHRDWELEFEYVKKVYDEILKTSFFEAYASQKNCSEEDDRKLVIKFFKEVIAPADFLNAYFEDRQLTWENDLPLVNTFMLKQLKKIKVGEWNSLVLPSVLDIPEEIDFGLELLEKVIVNNDLLQSEIAGKTPNWDMERIAKMDAIILKIAIAELLYFRTIPTKVTLNEYLEIAKEYSTPKSSTFINGVLDKVFREFQSTQRLNKEGRGLL